MAQSSLVAATIPHPALSPAHPKRYRYTTKAQQKYEAWLEDPQNNTSSLPIAVRRGLIVCTPKQAKFAVLTALGFSQREAYEAVYDLDPDSRTSRDSTASDIMAHPKVSALYSAIRDHLGTQWLNDGLAVRDWGLSVLHDEATEGNKGADRIAATKLILQLHGQLVDRKEVVHRDGRDVDSLAALAQEFFQTIASASPQVIETTAIDVSCTDSTTSTTCKWCNRSSEAEPDLLDGAGI